MSGDVGDTLIAGRARPIDGFPVARVLPAIARRLVGPFCFFDHLGPVDLPPETGFDVRPHPHIGLSTVTYVFEGAVFHRDSLGSEATIRPGSIHWMTAGRGIVHSERTPPEERSRGMRLHALQLWVALPQEHEETEPSFRHYPGDTLPKLEVAGVHLRVLAGNAYGVVAPVAVHSPLFYVEAQMPAGTSLTMPDEHPERAVYVVTGTVEHGETVVPERSMLVFGPGSRTVRAREDAHVVLVGGAPLESPRHIEWNFVSSSQARIERAKDDWRGRRFPAIPGDDEEFIPLP